MWCIMLWCLTVRCIVICLLRCVAVYCVMLCCVMLWCVVLCCSVLCHVVLCCSVLLKLWVLNSFFLRFKLFKIIVFVVRAVTMLFISTVVHACKDYTVCVCVCTKKGLTHTQPAHSSFRVITCFSAYLRLITPFVLFFVCPWHTLDSLHAT